MGKELLTDSPDSSAARCWSAARPPSPCPASYGRRAQRLRIGVPTKTYWPTIIAETAIRQKLFEKEGIKAELTIYRSGAEGFEAIAAGAADLILNSSSSVAAGLLKGVNARCVANGANGYYGWYLVVKTGFPITKVAELAGKKVGITSAGSGTDILRPLDARRAQDRLHARAARRRRPGAEPADRQHRRHRALLAAHLQGDRREGGAPADRLRRRGACPFRRGSWIASDKIIKERPQVVQKALNALYGGVAFLRADANRDCRRQADRRDRRDPRGDRRAASSTATSRSCRDRRDEARMDGAGARHGAADRHEGAGAGQGDLRHAVQAGPDDGLMSGRHSDGES